MNGLDSWFDVELFNLPTQIKFTTSPYNQFTKWKSYYFYKNDDVNVQKGDVLKDSLFCLVDEKTNEEMSSLNIKISFHFRKEIIMKIMIQVMEFNYIKFHLVFKEKNSFISNWLNVFNIILNNLQIKKIFNKFSSQLKFINIIINEFSGDVNLSREQIEKTNLFIGIPEKWDLFTRKHDDIFNYLKLMLIDEIHFLNEDRERVLEFIVARTIRKSEIN